MHLLTKNNIIRIINNRSFEDHPFKSGGGGMWEFGSLLTLIKKADDPTMEEVKTLIDNLLGKIHLCHSCYAKLLVYGELIFQRKFLHYAVEYRIQYQEHMKTNPEQKYVKLRILPLDKAYYEKVKKDWEENPRDYKKEVLDFIAKEEASLDKW